MPLKIEIDDKATQEQIEDFYLPSDYLEHLNKSFEKLLEFLKEHNLKYFIECGTLLGCVREGGQIKFDDDADIGMFQEDYDKIKELKYELYEKHKLFLREDPHCIKILSDYYFIRTFNYRQVKKACCIDIFLYKLEDGKIMLSSVENQNQFKDCYYLEEEFYPLKEYKYDNLIVLGANNPEPFLERYYGDWKKKVIYLEH